MKKVFLLLLTIITCFNFTQSQTVTANVEVTGGYVFSTDDKNNTTNWITGESSNKFVLGQCYLNTTGTYIIKKNIFVGNILLGFDTTKTVLRNAYIGFLKNDKDIKYSIYGGLIDNPYYSYNTWNRRLMLETPSDFWGFLDRSDYGLTGSIGFQNFVFVGSAFNGAGSKDKNYMFNVLGSAGPIGFTLLYSHTNKKENILGAAVKSTFKQFTVSAESIYKEKRLVISGTTEFSPIKKWSLIARYDYYLPNTDNSNIWEDMKVFGITYRPLSELELAAVYKNGGPKNATHTDLGFIAKISL